MRSACSFPGPWHVEPTEGGHFVVEDATGFSICYVYARKDEALRGSYMTHAEALNSETAGLTTFLRLTGLTAAVEV